MMSTRPQYVFPGTQDERIHDDVCRQLTWQTDIQSEEIEVDVKGSTVLLSGYVETCCEKLEAERAAKAAFGVTGVMNKIIVAPKRPRTDYEIRRDIIAALRACTSVVEEVPDVHVNDGVVLLQGRSRWEFQRQGAERMALAIIGVKSVVNLMDVDSNAETLQGLQKTIRFCHPSPLASLKAS